MVGPRQKRHFATIAAAVLPKRRERRMLNDVWMAKRAAERAEVAAIEPREVSA